MIPAPFSVLVDLSLRELETLIRTARYYERAWGRFRHVVLHAFLVVRDFLGAHPATFDPPLPALLQSAVLSPPGPSLLCGVICCLAEFLDAAAPRGSRALGLVWLAT